MLIDFFFKVTRKKILSQTNSFEISNSNLRCKQSHREKCHTEQDLESDFNGSEDKRENKTSKYLGRMLNVQDALNKKYLTKTISKFEISGGLPRKRKANYVKTHNSNPGYSMEKISTIDSSTKDLLEQDYEKLEASLNLPKQTYLKHLSKHLNDKKVASNISSLEKFSKLYQNKVI